MRAVAGMVALNLALAAPGMALLVALRLVRPRPRELAAAFGLALLTGIAVAGPVLIAALVAGLKLTAPMALLLIALLTAALSWVAARRVRSGPDAAEDPPAAPRTGLDRWLARAAGAGALAYFAIGASAVSRTAPVQDGASIWAMKTFALFHHGELIPEAFESEAIERSHHDYPILQPVLHSLVYRFAGRGDVGLGNVETWVILGAAVWAAVFLLARAGVRLGQSFAPIAAMPLLVIVTSPAILIPTSLGFADGTVACLTAVTALALGLWLQHGDHRYLVLGALLLGAAANTKNEGLGFAVALFAAAGIVVLAARRDLLRPLVGAGVLTVATILPWRLWLALNHVDSTDYPGLSTALDPGYLSDRTARFTQARDHLVVIAGDQAQWIWIGPALVVACVAALLAGRIRRVAAFYLVAVLLVFATLVYAYWVSKLDIDAHLFTSAPRTMTSVMLVGAAGVAHLLAVLLARSAVRTSDGIPRSAASTPK